MRIKHILLSVCLLQVSFLKAQEEKKSQFYSFGFGIEQDFLMTKTRMANLNYFTTNYSNGSCTSLLFKNQISIGNWFARVDIGYGHIRQKQNIVFSNVVDPIIEFEVSHNLNQWQFNYGFGRKIKTRKNLDFIIQLGATTYGFFGAPSGEKSGSFESRYYDYDVSLSAGQESIESYTYSISYRGEIDIVPWLKFGSGIECGTGALEFGLNYKFNRMYYQNFIIIKSQNYTAIANSRSASNSVGIFINYFF